ncbi:glutathione S-transferase [Ectothiorhodospiraceae bacterium 2226]|nr:glutathione S-transferase [Ectothiorhodospiraceae bacterium 2226]
MTLRLVGVPLCPYVQRVAIVLHEQGLAYERVDIDLKWPPDWFLARSPLLRVPLLLDGERALFESLVICDYLDALARPSLAPPAAWQQARERAYAALADELLAAQYRAMDAIDEEAWEAARATERRVLEHLERELAGRYFGGEGYRLVDAAYAPYAQRLTLLEAWRRDRAEADLREGLPRITSWLAALARRASTRAAAEADFAERFRAALHAQRGAHHYV